MRKLLSVSLICGVLFLGATSRSDVAPAALSADITPIDEPITGEPIVANPTVAPSTRTKDPFAPYDPGPASATWRYSDLSAAERAVVDRGRKTEGWAEINSAFSSASAEQAKRAAAAAAGNQLGVAGLAETGVVP